MKRISAILLFFSISITSYSQATFNKQHDFDYFFKVLTSVLPTDSCYYATGIIVDTTNSNYQIGNIFGKFDLNGEVEFTKTLFTPGKFFETWQGDLIVTDNGEFFDIGSAKDSTIKALLIKYNADGDTLFTKEFLHPYYPDESFQYIAQIKMDANGDLIILGGIDGDTTEVSNMDAYILKLDSLGNVLNTKIIPSSYTETPLSLLLESDGGYIIGSKKANTEAVSQNFITRAHIFKMNSEGGIEWEYTTHQNHLFDVVRDLVKTPDGGLIGATGKGIEHYVNQGYSQLRWFPYMLKLNANHEFQWGREFRSVRPIGSASMIKITSATDNSGYIGIGRILEKESVEEEVFGSWIVKASPEGDSLWARYYSFFDDIQIKPNPYDLKNTPDGGYIIVGETNPVSTEGIKYRAWMMKVDEYGCLIPGCHLVDDVEESSIEELELAIYPNPSSDYLNFQLRGGPTSKKGLFRIVDAQGKIIRTLVPLNLNDTCILPVFDWADGVYFLQYIEENHVIHTAKFIKN